MVYVRALCPCVGCDWQRRDCDCSNQVQGTMIVPSLVDAVARGSVVEVARPPEVVDGRRAVDEVERAGSRLGIL